MSNCTFIIPVLNEEKNVPTLVAGWKTLINEIRHYDLKFIVIDDGSTDQTVSLLKHHATDINLQIISHKENKGPGSAFGSGFSLLYNTLKDGDVVVTMEGDNTSNLDTLSIMLGRIEREGVQVALASPYAYGGGIINTNFFRCFLSFTANNLIKIVLGITGIHTFSSFYRAYRADIFNALQDRYGPKIIERNGFECMIELLKKTISVNASITEVPMSLDTSKRAGKSKMKIFKTMQGYFSIMIQSWHWE